MVFCSTVEARYFFSTDSLAAAAGLASTHLAALSKARVAAADAFGLRARNLPFTSTAQQYSSLYGASAAWSAMLRTLPSASSKLPIGSEFATASTSPLSRANPSSPAGNTSQVVSLPGSIAWAPRKRSSRVERVVAQQCTQVGLTRA